VYFLLGIDDTDSPITGEAAQKTATLALTLGQKLESLALARLLNISCHQLFQHPSIQYSSGNTACCLLLDSDSQKLREIDLTTRLILRSESAVNANPGYALAPWNQFDPDVVTWGKNAKTTKLERMDAITLARHSGIATAGIAGNGAGVIGALAAVGLRYDGSDGYIDWMPGLDKLSGIHTQIEINQYIHIESIESDQHKRPALDDRIQFTENVKPILKNGRIVLLVSSVKRGAEFEWKS
jgi:hypothetical protein